MMFRVESQNHAPKEVAVNYVVVQVYVPLLIIVQLQRSMKYAKKEEKTHVQREGLDHQEKSLWLSNAIMMLSKVMTALSNSHCIGGILCDGYWLVSP